MFNSGSQVNLIVVELGVEVHDHKISYPLGWENKDVEIKVTKQCKIISVIDVDIIDEVELDVVLHDACEVVFESPYMYMWNAIFMWRANQYHLIKDGKSFAINMHKEKSKILLVSSNQAKKLFSFHEKCVLLF